MYTRYWQDMEVGTDMNSERRRWFHSFIHSFNRYLLSTSSVLGIFFQGLVIIQWKSSQKSMPFWADILVKWCRKYTMWQMVKKKKKKKVLCRIKNQSRKSESRQHKMVSKGPLIRWQLSRIWPLRWHLTWFWQDVWAVTRKKLGKEFPGIEKKDWKSSETQKSLGK